MVVSRVTYLNVGSVQIQGHAGIRQCISIALCLQVGETSVTIVYSHRAIELYGLCVVVNGVLKLLCWRSRGSEQRE